MDKLHMRIPEDTVTPEEFTAIRVQLRMFFGVPAEIIPDTYEELCADLRSDRSLHRPVGRPLSLRLWLVTHNYEVLRDGSGAMCNYFVIRPERAPSFGAEAVARRIRDDIDKRVVSALLGEDVP
jgi:hypothetical protein